MTWSSDLSKVSHQAYRGIKNQFVAQDAEVVSLQVKLISLLKCIYFFWL